MCSLGPSYLCGRCPGNTVLKASLWSVWQEPEDVVVPVAQRRAWCWCMCFGLAFMLAGVILGGAYLYKYFAFQVSRVHFVTRALCVFHRFPCVQKRSVCLNRIALLLSFLSLESFSLSTGKEHGLFCQQRRAGPIGQIKRNNSFENLTENGLYLNIGLEYKNPSGVPDFHPLFLTFSTCQALKVA